MPMWMDILLWVGAGVWMVLLVQGIINWIVVRDISKLELPEPQEWPLVSFVVPARNEEWHIRDAVTRFCEQDYPNYEVIVVDDRSTDATPEILAELQEKYAHLKVVQGKEPPPGWLGKPNALEVGRAHATGEWVLMVDADARYERDVLRRGVAYALNCDAGMAVLRPRVSSGGVLEAILMSSVNFFFFVATPLFLVNVSRSKLFATGSPVFNLIRRDALEAVGGFVCLKQEVVDDVAIGYKVRSAGFKLVTAYSGPLIKLHMYDGAMETVRGFAKTTYPTIRKAPYLLPLMFAIGGIINFLPYYGLIASLLAGAISVPAVISLVLMHVVFAGIAIHFAEPWYIGIANPLRELGWWWIFARSLVIYYRKGVVWRDRSYASM
jgi:cellulose synthase/poly-beta-1,6-N-acetylglucosamine synthase-like glycosyltransferase